MGFVRENDTVKCSGDVNIETLKLRGYEFLKSLIPKENDFGAVYLYRNTKTRALVEVKQVSHIRDGKDVSQKLMRHVNYDKQLKHPNIVYYYDSFIVGPHRELFIVWEYTRHGSLRDLIDDRIFRWNPVEAIEMIREIISGAHFLTSMKFGLHYLSPEHVMLGDDGYLKVCFHGPCTSLKTDSETLAGMRAYSYYAPEKWYKYGKLLTTRSVVWSIGMIFYELCTLRNPYGPITTTDELFDAFENGDVKICGFGGQYGFEVEDFLKLMLQKDRQKRKCLTCLLKHKLLKIRKPVYFHIE